MELALVFFGSPLLVVVGILIGGFMAEKPEGGE